MKGKKIVAIFFVYFGMLMIAQPLRAESGIVDVRSRKLYNAIKARDKAKVKVLLEKGADPNKAFQYWYYDNLVIQIYPLYRAVDMGEKEIVNLLLNYGANADATSFVEENWGKEGGEGGALPNTTALHAAVNRGQSDIAELLLKHGANVDVKDEYGRTPLFTAAEKGNVKMALFLIKHGAKVNMKDEHWLTPLHIAAQKGKKSVAMLLLRHNAQLYAKSATGVTPKQMARKFGHRNMFREWEKGKVR